MVIRPLKCLAHFFNSQIKRLKSWKNIELLLFSSTRLELLAFLELELKSKARFSSKYTSFSSILNYFSSFFIFFNMANISEKLSNRANSKLSLINHLLR